MSRNQRLLLAAVAAAAMIAALVLLRPSANKTDTTATSPVPNAGGERGETTRAPGPARERVLLPAGKVRTITVDKAETVRLAARSSRDDELHMHSYDLTKTRRPARRYG